MPRTPRNSPNKPGRPPKVVEAASAAVLAVKTGMPREEAAKRAGTSGRTLRRHAAAGKSGAMSSSAAAPPAAGPLTGSPLDRLRAYAAHDPEALVALEALQAPPEEGLGRDELQALRDGLVLAAKLVREAADVRKGGAEGDDGPLLRALQRLEGLGKTVATVKAKRPPEDGPDEATRRIVAARPAAIDRMGILTSDKALTFAAKRQELDTWCASLGAFGAEVKTRVDAMLGGPAT